MPKSISVSKLRTQIKRILNEGGHGQSEYVVEKFGEPIVAVINMKDFRMLQEVKRSQQSEPVTDSGDSFASRLAAIHQTLVTSGYRSRTKAEIDAEVETERESWGR